MKNMMRVRLSTVVFAACSVLLLVGPVFAAVPWSFVRQLPAANSGVTIDLPSSVTIDVAKQRYYVVDAEGGQLVSFDKDGKFLAAFNAGGELKIPLSLARTSSGVLWVVNRGSNELLYINPRQQKVQKFILKYPDGAQVLPAKVAVDSKNRLFVLDQRRGGILQLDDNLAIVQQYDGGKTFQGFVDFKLKGDQLWALDGLSSTVYQFSVAGAAAGTIALSGLEFPVSLEVDSAGQFYILDRHAGQIVVFGPSGDLRFRFLGKGKRHGQLWYANQLVFDWEERLCVVDEGNGRIDILTR